MYFLNFKSLKFLKTGQTGLLNLFYSLFFAKLLDFDETTLKKSQDPYMGKFIHEKVPPFPEIYTPKKTKQSKASTLLKLQRFSTDFRYHSPRQRARLPRHHQPQLFRNSQIEEVGLFVQAHSGLLVPTNLRRKW